MSYQRMSHGKAYRKWGEEFFARMADLAALSFSSFEGVTRPAADNARWYYERPGRDHGRSLIVADGDDAVSNVSVTGLRFTVGDTELSVGFIDSVMTHPDHRRRGLAKDLLVDAIEELRTSGFDATALYTLPGSPAFAIYERLGYVPYCATSLWTFAGDAPLSRAATGLSCRIVDHDAEQSVRDLVNRFHGAKNGFVPLDPELWRWRKRRRPAHMPAAVVRADDGDRLVGTAAFCRVDLVSGERYEPVTFIADLAWQDADGASVLRALAQETEPNGRYVLLVGENDERMNDLLRTVGFSPEPGETCLIRPFSPAAAAAVQAPGRPWYVLPESTAGV